MSGGHELERFDAVDAGSASAGWLDASDSLCGSACGALLAMGLAVRLSSVGYGRALRVGITDGRGWTGGWTVGSSEELQGLFRGLLAPGAEEYVLRRLERPRKNR